jgi:HAD superfamily hydrolase (TIGR01509 family)
MTTPTDRPILLLDVMSTLVYDPFLNEMPAYFGKTIDELIATKHPDAWVRFEHGEISEQTFYEIFFPDGPTIDAESFRAMLHDSYRLLDGIEELLGELREHGVPMHTLSNYPVWHEIIEEKTALSRWVNWTFVSCKMGVRKPDPRAYTLPARELGVSTSQCIFVDDRGSNCRAAVDVGMRAIKFESAPQLRDALIDLGVLPTT